MSIDSIHLGLTNETRYFYMKAKNGSRYKNRLTSDENLQQFDESSEEHVRIKVKNFNLNTVNAPVIRETILTKNGIIGSERNSAVQGMIIGRLEVGEDGLKPNDIILPNSDRAVSRVHACMIYKYGFS